MRSDGRETVTRCFCEGGGGCIGWYILLVSIRRGASLPLVVGMMVATEIVEHHPDECYHPHKQPTFNDSQCHGRRLPLSMDKHGLFTNTCDRRLMLLLGEAFLVQLSRRTTSTPMSAFDCRDDRSGGSSPSRGSDEGIYP